MTTASMKCWLLVLYVPLIAWTFATVLLVGVIDAAGEAWREVRMEHAAWSAHWRALR